MQVIEFQVPPLPLLATVGHALWHSGTIHAKRKFQLYDLLIVVSGAIYIEEDDICYELTKGSILILEPNKIHRGYRASDELSEVYWLHFIYDREASTISSEHMNWPQPLAAGNNETLTAQTATLHLPKHSVVELRPLIPLLDRMVEIHTSLVRQHSFELYAVFNQFLVQLQNGIRERLHSRSYYLSEQAAHYIEQSITRPFNSSQMEQELHYHFDYITRCLKQYSGLTPIQYRHHVQIELAKRLLLHTELSLKEIGAKCGLNDPNYFTRVFKKGVELTPAQYRKKYQVFITVQESEL
ncbi:helix-turn-helix domain-containing protein [Paenibacillus sp. GXUN7292]|uniref:helix-turn-helix transcriptional regulator n=1 Tax=Paenibacillus sp. GXUN7292 TaxID=3422499 RepID=UPI003D7E3B55